jgi:translation elongation factor EF-Tu-like GTPase
MPSLDTFPIITAAGLLTCLLVAPAVQAGPTITLIGDNGRSTVMEHMAAGEQSDIRHRDGVDELMSASAGVTLRNLAPGSAVIAMADLLLVSDIALIVMDSTVGPTPVIREHILIARQARVPMLAVLVSNVARLYARAPAESAEILAIEIEAVRGLLSAYDFDAKSVRFYFDAPVPQPVEGVAGFGNREALRALSTFVPRRVRTADTGPVTEIWSAVYLLTELETVGAAVSLAPQDSIMVWSEGTHSKATLSSVSQYHPGDFREMSLSLESPVSGKEGSRILLVSGERVVGLGAITQIGH